MINNRLKMVVALILCNSLAACSGGGGGSGSLPGPRAASRASAATGWQGNVQSSDSISINSGGSGTAPWVADTDSTGGWVAVVTNPIDVSQVYYPAPQAVYQSQRTGTAFSYVVPNLQPGGVYRVRLHFVESWFHSPGQRIFSVTINGAPALTDFDIFAAAGGQNIGVVKGFNATAPANGTITIALKASVNNASIAGVQVIAIPDAPSPAPTQAPTPPPSPSPSPTEGPQQYPVYSSFYTGYTPFHQTVAQLMNSGAQVQSATIASHYWAQAPGNNQPTSQSGSDGALYLAAPGQQAYVFSCPTWGACNANGLIAHYPAGAYAETGSDHHLQMFDPIYLHGEIDGWGGDGNPHHACNLTPGNPGTATCSWGGFFPFSGSGLAGAAGSSANAGGYAYGLIDLNAQELLNGHILHALGINQSCLDNGGVYPSLPGRTTDAQCSGGTNNGGVLLEPNAVYGQMIHLKSSVNINAYGYSKYCLVIVQALQEYGAYTTDNNGAWGITLDMEQMNDYVGTNPWYTTIFPSMVAGGDGHVNGSDYTTFSFSSCLQRIHASDIEVIQL